MDGKGSVLKYPKIKPNQYPDIRARLVAGEAYGSLAKQYKVSISTINRLWTKLGIDPELRRQRKQTVLSEQRAIVLKRLAEEPQISKVLKELGLGHHVFKKLGPLSQTEEYLSAKKRMIQQVACGECGVDLKGSRYFGRRWCPKCGKRKRAELTTAYIIKRYHSDPAYRKKILAYNHKMRLARKSRIGFKDKVRIR